MDNKEKYIRYRIYTQSAEQADRNYPRRVCKNLKNLHQNIVNDKDFWLLVPEYPIRNKTFIPKDLNHINPKYYHLIGYIAEYFNCYAIWKKTMILGSIKPINTFQIIGFNQDQLLAYHHISKLIDNLNDMRYNMRKEYRRVKINRRRRGDKINEKANASVKASNFLYRSLDNIYTVLDNILENRPNNQILDKKRKLLESHIRELDLLDFRLYHYGDVPKIKNAFSREGKFQNKRLITVNY